jgi:O-antigen/teichoic acid export membrane protein
MNNTCLILSALTNALALSLLSSYIYAEKYNKLLTDFHRLLAFILWITACWLIPALLFYTLFEQNHINDNRKLTVLLAWAIPVLIIEVFFYKKGYLKANNRKGGPRE